MELFEEEVQAQPEQVDYSDNRVMTEIHRIKGFLRFSPDDKGVYVARCSPDFFILPALAWHFTRRFGKTPWAIIDEKRGLCLQKDSGRAARLVSLSDTSHAGEELPEDSWEELWRLHHRFLSNEARKNPSLQRQFMPKRYHKHLPELKL